MSAARIGRIRMKNGGADVRVLRTPTRDNGGSENWCGALIKSAQETAGFSEPGAELCGYVVVGIYTDGMHSLGYRFDETRSRIPSTLMPSLVAELIRRDVVTKGKFKELFEQT